MKKVKKSALKQSASEYQLQGSSGGRVIFVFMSQFCAFEGHMFGHCGEVGYWTRWAFRLVQQDCFADQNKIHIPGGAIILLWLLCPQCLAFGDYTFLYMASHLIQRLESSAVVF